MMFFVHSLIRNGHNNKCEFENEFEFEVCSVKIFCCILPGSTWDTLDLEEPVDHPGRKQFALALPLALVLPGLR